jgi:hypothetical protein
MLDIDIGKRWAQFVIDQWGLPYLSILSPDGLSYLVKRELEPYGALLADIDEVTSQVANEIRKNSPPVDTEPRKRGVARMFR